jgi:hypothetical protein
MSITQATHDRMARLSITGFQAWRDTKGYRLVNAKPPMPQRVVRKGGKLEPCRSLEIADLYLIFASKTTTTPEGVLDFVERYGALTLNGNDASEGEKVDGKGGIIPYAFWMRSLLDAHRRRQAPPWGNLPSPPGGSVSSTIKIGVRAVWNPEIKALQWQLRPVTLLDGLWLQFGQALMRNAQLRVCEHCGAWFEAGAGTGRRLDAKFCSDEHRVTFNSLKRSRDSCEHPRKGEPKI